MSGEHYPRHSVAGNPTTGGWSTVNLKAALEAAQQEPKPKFEQWVESLPADDSEALILAAPSNRISHRAFHDVVKAAGVKVGRETLADWRKAHGFSS